MANRDIYSRLKRLFSSNVIVRHRGGKELKVTDTSRIQSYMSNAVRDRYSKIHASTGYATSGTAYGVNLAYQTQRIMLFRDYDVMDCDPIITAALDMIAFEASQKDEYGRVLNIFSSDENVKEILHNLFYDILNIEFSLYPWIRNFIKYGDLFLFLEISPHYGIHNVLPLSVYDTQRIEGSKPENPYYVYFETLGANGYKQSFENYEVAHFRLLSDTNFLPYGRCCVSTTYVDTLKGTSQIKDLNIGEYIWCFNNTTRQLEPTRIVNKVCSGTKKILKITTPHNFIECSENHPILVATRDKELIYKTAAQIEVGDVLLISNNSKKICDEIIIDKAIPNDVSCPRFEPEIDTVPEMVNEEFAEFCGFMLGDGWIKGTPDDPKYNGYRVCFACGTDEQQNEKYKSILEKYVGKETKYYKTGNTQNSKTVLTYSKRLYYILKNMGISGTAKTKRVPSWIFNSKPKIQKAFIEGIGNADASVTIDKWGVIKYQLELTNKDLILDIKRLLQMLNIKSSEPKLKRLGGKKDICGVECNASATYYIVYYPNSKHKQQIEKYNYFDTNDVLLEPVKSICENGEKETWDIQVESPHSNFIANGIVVHNSYIEGSRRAFRQLVLMEDAMLIHRIMRAPEKRIFKIDVGNIPPSEIKTYMERLMADTKKVPFIDQRTGDYNLRYNMQNILQDFYIPVRGKDDSTDISNLGGLEYNAIEDVEYILKRMLASLKIPRAFFGYEEAMGGDKTSIASQDIRFADQIEWIQRVFVSELQKIAIVHLFCQGYTGDELTNFELSLANPSTLKEKEKIELMKSRLDLVTQMGGTKFFDRNWIYENIFHMHQEEYDAIKDRIVEDEKYMFRLMQIQNGQPDPAKFGYPQNNAQPQAQPGQPPAPGQSPQDNTGQPVPMSVDDLPTEDEVTNQNEEETRGRPRGGSQVNQDSSQLGRDPFGFKKLYQDRSRVSKRPASKKYRSPLSLEMKDLLSQMERLNKKSDNLLTDGAQQEGEVINEDKGTYMDESNIVDNE